MKEVTCYQCSICKEVYSVKDVAISCEQTHTANEDLGIVDTVHRADFSRYGFPEKLTLERINHSGCLAEYEMVREGPVEEFQ
jgi:hypothetical protein